MPSGRTHDRITWYCLPVISLSGFWLTQQLDLTLTVAAGFLFGGLMFGPDLDVRSRQSRRWGMFAWIWRPYRGWLRHRSWLSHGPIAGTVLRLLILGLWLLLLTLAGLEIAHALGWAAITWGELGRAIGQTLWRDRGIWLALVIGLELGAMSHSLSDWIVSRWKRTTKSSTAKSSTAKSSAARSGPPRSGTPQTRTRKSAQQSPRSRRPRPRHKRPSPPKPLK